MLVPLDGSQLGESALTPDFLSGLTFRSSMITLLHVTLPPGLSVALGSAPGGEFGPASRGDAGAAEKYLAGVAERVAPWGVRVNKHVLRSPAIADSILTFAKTNGVDLIAMGTHGRGGLARLIPGSVATGVVRNGNVPTLLFPPPAARKRAGQLGAAVLL